MNSVSKISTGNTEHDVYVFVAITKSVCKLVEIMYGVRVGVASISQPLAIQTIHKHIRRFGIVPHNAFYGFISYNVFYLSLTVEILDVETLYWNFYC